ncbi:hypothetical protein NDU88_002985 [Pleurodeles waltl]|uniref:Uncharacterized protein n=1 Tax=Pleurodeles waltl TaxID=8319 RepID=A0AAV7W642_PLEWA|nr:hypothetical protein NDU88_002985 [Pleurodeles waltl]
MGHLICHIHARESLLGARVYTAVNEPDCRRDSLSRDAALLYVNYDIVFWMLHLNALAKPSDAFRLHEDASLFLGASLFLQIRCCESGIY